MSLIEARYIDFKYAQVYLIEARYVDIIKMCTGILHEFMHLILEFNK